MKKLYLTPASLSGKLKTFFIAALLFFSPLGGMRGALAQPVADFTFNYTNGGCTPDSVVFTNLSTGSDAWRWNFGDFSPESTAQNPFHVYTGASTFTVTLTAYNTVSGDSSKIMKPLTINMTPWPGYAWFWTSPANPVCPGVPVQFNGPMFPMPPATGSYWNFGDGDSLTTMNLNPVHTYTDTGMFTVTFILYAQCGSDTQAQFIIVDSSAKPSANFSAWPNPICPNQDFDFWNSTMGATSYLWTFGDGDSSTVFDPTHIYSDTGNYSISLFAFNNCGSDTFSLVQNVVDTITPSVSAWVSDDSVCTNTAINFSGWSSNAVSYLWSFGDGDNSLQQNAFHAYTALGTYTATFTATNACSKSKSVNITIKVLNNLPPENVDFWTSPWSSCPSTSGICPGSTVKFTNSSSDLGTSFWNFGDASTSNLNNPTHVFAAAGSYNVKLVVTSSCGGKDSITKCVLVKTDVVPSVFFCVNTCGPASPVCVGSIVKFINNSSDTTFVSWDFGDSSTSTLVNPTHIYADTGTYIVSLTVTNPCGNSATSYQTITVTTTGAPPNLMGVWANPTSVCPGQPVSMSGWAFTATSYKWLFGDGDSVVSSMGNTTHSYFTPGNYSSTVIAYNGCGSDTGMIQIFVKPGPSPDFNFNIPCTGDTVYFTDATTPVPNSWAWDFGDGDTSSSQNPAHLFAADGMYNVLLQASDSGCNSQVIKQVIAGINLNTAKTDASCGLPNGQASVNVISGHSPYFYLWNTAQTTSAITGITAGTYKVTVTDALSCVDSATVIVNNVGGAPSTAPSSATATPDTICAGGNITLTVAGGSLGTGANWIWHRDSCSGIGIGAGGSIIVSPASPTTYFVRAEGLCNTTSCVSVSVTVYSPVTANAGADAFVCTGDTYTLSGAIGGGASSGTWTTSGTGMFNNPALLNATYTPSAVDILMGSVTLTLTTNNPPGPCPSATDAMILTINITATASAGADATICEGSTYALSGSRGGGATSSLWTTSGDGTFNNPALVNAIYTPGASDITMGSATLAITTDDPPGSCTAASDTMVLTIDSAATVNAGIDDTICKNSTYVLSGTIGGSATSSTWTTSGTGNFDNPALLNAIYSPSNGDDAMGAVTLTITTNNPPGVCPAVSDAMVLTILAGAEATASAGANAIICEGSSYTLSGARGGSATSSTWTTSGTGTFDNPALLAATYTPSPADNTIGSVTLTITTNDPPGVCPPASDYMILTINPAAIANSGTDTSVCVGSPITLSGIIGGSASSALWSTSGDGLFNNPALLAATYTPGATDISMGTVTLTLTTNDPAGPCLPGTDFMILTISSLPAPSLTVNDVSCNGLCDGSETATVSGGTAPFTYLWSVSASSQTTSSATGLCAGLHAITVTDSNGCAGSSSASVSEPVVLTASVTATVDASCAGICDGNATVTPADGTPPYTYIWDDPGTQTVQMATGLCAGNFSVTLTDNNGCTTSSSAAITEPAVISATAGSDSSTCGNNDGAAYVSASGGTPPYAYLWDDPLSQANDTAINLSSGAYNVTVTDANGCTGTSSVTVNDIGAPVSSVSVVNNVSCAGGNDGEAAVNVSGGTPPYTYIWDDPGVQTASAATGLLAGTYLVTVSDTSGCNAIASGTITEPVVLSVVASSTDAHCGQSDGSLSAVASGGIAPYTYFWTPGGYSAAIVNLIPAGNYFLTLTDNNGCSITDSVTVNDLPGGTVAISSSTDVSCNSVCDGIATATMTGGFAPFTYAWNTVPVQLSATATGLCAGNFTVAVIDTFGCTDSVPVTINEPAVLSLAGSYTMATCNGACDGSANISVSGGTSPYNFIWDDPLSQTSDTATGLCAGNVNVTVTDANICTAVVTGTVNEPTALSLSLSSLDASCGGNDGAAAVAVAGGTSPYSYLWDTTTGGQTTDTAVALAAGIYSVTVTDTNGCTTTASATVNNSGAPALSVSSLIDVLCNGDSSGAATVSASGGFAPYTYQWDDPMAQTTATANGLAAGAYALTVTDAAGCESFITATVTEPAKLMAAVTSKTDNSCNGDSNGSIDITVSGGVVAYTFLWSNSAATEDISGLTAGTYSFTVTDANGCSISESSTITEPAVLIITADSIKNTSCSICDGEITVSSAGGTAPYTYSWSNGATGNIAGSLCAGSYSTTVTDANGCQINISEVVTGPAGLTSSISSSADATCFNACDGDAAVLVSGGTTPYTYNWNSGETSSNVSNLCAGSYSVTATDASGCTTVSGVSVTEPTELLITIDSTDATCGICVDGSADLTVSGGAPPYAYAWSNGDVTEDIDSVLQGTYYVTVTDANGCIATDSITVDFTVRTVLIQDAGGRMEVYPNPNNGKFEIRIFKLEIWKIEIYNVFGEKVYSEIILNSKSLTLNLDVSGWNEGVYLIRLTGEREMLTKKFVIGR